MLAVLEWVGFNPTNKTWPQFKRHFPEAYDIHLQSETVTNSHHGAANVIPGTSFHNKDDDSIETIPDVLTTIQLANNANSQNVSQELQAFRSALMAKVAARMVAPPQYALIKYAPT